MEVYSRQINPRVWFFRGLLSILLFIVLDSFSKELSTIGYPVVLLIVFLGCIRITGLTIYNDSVKIERYYFFGLFRRTWTTDKYQAQKARLVKKFERLPMGSDLDFVYLFFPKYKFQGIVLPPKNPKR